VKQNYIDGTWRGPWGFLMEEVIHTDKGGGGEGDRGKTGPKTTVGTLGRVTSRQVSYHKKKLRQSGITI